VNIILTSNNLINKFDLINIDNVTPYLLKHKLIDIKSIVEGDLQIFDVSRKNRNIKLIRKNNSSFIVCINAKR
jgi:hypothetical protein